MIFADDCAGLEIAVRRIEAPFPPNRPHVPCLEPSFAAPRWRRLQAKETGDGKKTACSSCLDFHAAIVEKKRVAGCLLRARSVRLCKLQGRPRRELRGMDALCCSFDALVLVFVDPLHALNFAAVSRVDWKPSAQGSWTA